MNMERLDLSIWDVEEAGGVILYESNFDDSKMSSTPPSDPDCQRDEGGYFADDADDEEYNYSYSADEEREIKLAIKRSRRDIEYILKHHNFEHHKANVLMKLIEYLEKDVHNIRYVDIFDNTVTKKRKRND